MKKLIQIGIFGMILIIAVIYGEPNSITEIEVNETWKKYLPDDKLKLTECMAISETDCRVEDKHSGSGQMVKITIPNGNLMTEEERQAYVDVELPSQLAGFIKREEERTRPKASPHPEIQSEERTIKISELIIPTHICDSRLDIFPDGLKCYSLSPSTITCYTEENKKGGKRCFEGWKEI